MNKLHANILLVFFDLVAIGSLLFFIFLFFDWHAEINQQAHVVEVMSGAQYLLLPLMVPIIHLLSIVQARIDDSKRKRFEKIQIQIIWISLTGFLLVGWQVDRYLEKKLDATDYRECEHGFHGVRFSITSYSKDINLCPQAY